MAASLAVEEWQPNYPPNGRSWDPQNGIPFHRRAPRQVLLNHGARPCRIRGHAIGERSGFLLLDLQRASSKLR